MEWFPPSPVILQPTDGPMGDQPSSRRQFPASATVVPIGHFAG